MVPAVHLERQPAEVAETFLSDLEERAALAAQIARSRRGRSTLEEGHGKEDTGTSCWCAGVSRFVRT